MIAQFLKEKIPGCEHFYWKEVLWLPKWKVFAVPTPLQQRNLITVCKKAEEVRKILCVPLKVTSGLRPGVYNAYINGAVNSMHKIGGALDFQPAGFRSIGAMNEARNLIRPHLDFLDIRMENMSVADWIHIDIKKVSPGGFRFFKP